MANVVGSEGRGRTSWDESERESMKDVYKKSGARWPTYCAYCGCNEVARVASHVWVRGEEKNGPFLVPSCQQCNMKKEYQYSDKHRDGSAPFPAPLKWRTALVRDSEYDDDNDDRWSDYYGKRMNKDGSRPTIEDKKRQKKLKADSEQEELVYLSSD